MIKSWKNGWGYLNGKNPEPNKIHAIQEGLIKLNSKLSIINGSYVKGNNRQSQFFLPVNGQSVTIDFWENGMQWHSQVLHDTDKVSLAAYLWNDARADSNEIEKLIPEIKFPVERKKIEISNEEYLRWHWHNAVTNTKYKSQNEIELVQLLSKNETVNKLMTFHQLWDLGLSRHIGEFGKDLKNDLLRATITDDCIVVRTEQQAKEHFMSGAQHCLGKGNVAEAYKIIAANLPENTGWAEYQTLRQYLERVKQVE